MTHKPMTVEEAAFEIFKKQYDGGIPLPEAKEIIQAQIDAAMESWVALNATKSDSGSLNGAILWELMKIFQLSPGYQYHLKGKVEALQADNAALVKELQTVQAYFQASNRNTDVFGYKTENLATILKYPHPGQALLDNHQAEIKQLQNAVQVLRKALNTCVDSDSREVSLQDALTALEQTAQFNTQEGQPE